MRDLKEIAGVESFMVPKSEQASEIGTDVFFGGSVLPNDASLHPGLYHAGLVQRVTLAGGRIIDHTAVAHIEPASGGFRVCTARGENHRAERHRREQRLYRWPRSGAWAAHRSRWIGSHSDGRDSGGTLQSVAAEEPGLRQYQPRLLLFSGSARRAPHHLGGPRGALRRERVSRRLPASRGRHAAGLSGPERRARHACLGRPDRYTYDEVPHIGRTALGIHYALGYCGTGVSRATYFGNKIALQMLGSAEGRTAFDDLAFSPRFRLIRLPAARYRSLKPGIASATL